MLVDSLHWWIHQISPSCQIVRLFIQPKIEERDTLLTAASGHNFTGSFVLNLNYDLSIVAAHSLGRASVGKFHLLMTSEKSSFLSNWNIAGGDKLDYPGDPSSPAVSLLNVKIHINSTISYHHAREIGRA